MAFPDRVQVVDTVLGAVAPPGPARTGNVANTMPTHAGPFALIARGCLHRGDGGGGLFVWLLDSAAGDDGGTVILPNVHVPPPSQPTANGRWHRVYSGALDI